MGIIRSGVQYRDFREFQKKLAKLQNKDLNKLLESCAKEIAGQLLQKVITKTPIGNNIKSNRGKAGGALKRGWTSKTHEEAAGGGGNGKEPMSYARTLPVVKTGNSFMITIFNPVNYAVYVEYGHQNPNGKGWIYGKFMLTKSEQEMKEKLNTIIAAKLAPFFEGAFYV